LWPLASSGNGPDIVESSSSEEFGILSWPRGIHSANGCERPPTRLRSKFTSIYNVGGAEIDSRLTRGVSTLQYADDIVIYASENILQRVQKSLQESLNSVDVLLYFLGLSIRGHMRLLVSPWVEYACRLRRSLSIPVCCV
jgi:hypothetical protein